MQDLSHSDELALVFERARAAAAQARGEHAEARAFAQTLIREQDARSARRRAIAEERRSWSERREKADAHIAEIIERRGAAMEELETLADAPIEFQQQRRALLSQLSEAEAARKAASDERASAETALAEADRSARAALETMGSARESRAAAEERLEGARQRREQLLHAIATELETEPQGLFALAGVKVDDATPDAGVVERKLENLNRSASDSARSTCAPTTNSSRSRRAATR